MKISSSYKVASAILNSQPVSIVEVLPLRSSAQEPEGGILLRTIDEISSCGNVSTRHEDSRRCIPNQIIGDRLGTQNSGQSLPLAVDSVQSVYIDTRIEIALMPRWPRNSLLESSMSTMKFMSDPMILEGLFVVADFHEFRESRTHAKTNFNNYSILFTRLWSATSTTEPVFCARKVTEPEHGTIEVKRLVEHARDHNCVLSRSHIESIFASKLQVFACLKMQ